MSLPDNPFESGFRKVIPAVLVYIRRAGKILMIHRNAVHPGRVDYHEGKWNGLGGKCELNESPLEAALREVKEESGLALSQPQLNPLGFIQFPNFKAHKNEDWMVCVFTAELEAEDRQEPLKKSEEGDLHWIPAEDIRSLNVWPGDRHFLQYVVERRPFMGTIWYDGPNVKRYWIQPLVGT